FFFTRQSGLCEQASTGVSKGQEALVFIVFFIVQGFGSFMELRYWLIVVGVIVIVGILFDGWRRMRGGGGKLKFKLDNSFGNLPDADGDPDLLGPARVVDRKREPAFDEADMPTMSASELNRRRNIEPQQGDLNLTADEPVPTLLTPVEDEEEQPEAPRETLPVEEVLVINVLARDVDGF